MRTVRYIELGNRKVISRCDRLQIDPISTERNALEKAIDTAEFRALQDYVAKHKEKKVTFVRLSELQDLQVAYRNKCAELKKENPIYFEPRKNEIIVSLELFKKLERALKEAKPGQGITIDAEIIDLEKGDSNA